MKPLLLSGVIIALAAPVTAAPDLHPLAVAAAAYSSGQSSEPLRQLDDLLAETARDPALQPALEAVLIRMLQPAATPEARLFACQRLAIVGTAKSLPALEGLLANPDTVGMACLALANFPLPEADALLRQAVSTLQGTPRSQVILALGHRRDPQSVGLLTPLCREPEVEVAEAAITALGHIANRPALRSLARLRQTPPPGLELRVAQASLLAAQKLAEDGRHPSARTLFQTLLAPSYPDAVRAGALAAQLRLDPQRAPKIIFSILNRTDSALQPDTALRPVAIAAIGTLASPKTAESFAVLLPQLPEDEKVLLIQALADLGDLCPVPALVAQLDDPSAAVRTAVISALARLNTPDLLPALVRALGTAQSRAERRLAEGVLAQLPGGNGTDRNLLSQLNGASPEVSAALLNVLAQRGSTDAIPALFRATVSPNGTVARAGFQGLGRLAGPAELPPLLDAFIAQPDGPRRNDAQTAIHQVLARMRDVQGRSQAVVSKLGSTSDPASQAALVALLPLAGGSSALEAARTRFSSPNPLLRSAAIRALADWPTPEVQTELLALYRNSAEPPHQALALRGLVRLAREANAHPTADLTRLYADLLTLAKTPEDRKLVLGALAGCTSAETLELAVGELGKPEVRAEAEQAVRQIADNLKSTNRPAAEAALQKLQPAN